MADMNEIFHSSLDFLVAGGVLPYLPASDPTTSDDLRQAWASDGERFNTSAPFPRRLETCMEVGEFAEGDVDALVPWLLSPGLNRYRLFVSSPQIRRIALHADVDLIPVSSEETVSPTRR